MAYCRGAAAQGRRRLLMATAETSLPPSPAAGPERPATSPETAGRNAALPAAPTPTQRLLGIATLGAALLLATVLRLPGVTAGYPYLNYVDEGHVLHHVVHHLSVPTWEPSTYSYPTLPFYLVTGAALAWSPAYEAFHGRPLRADLSPVPFTYYDILEPADSIRRGATKCPAVVRQSETGRGSDRPL